MDNKHLTELLNIGQAELSPDQQHDIEEVYQQLKNIARVQRFKLHGPGKVSGQSSGLNTTALVNESWLKTHSKHKTFSNRDHFFAYCALAMRHILLDQARRNKLVTYVDDEQALDGHPVYKQSDFLLDLESQLERLGEFSPRLEKVFTYRFFGDMSFDSIAAVMQLSDRTVLREWKKARAMLAVALERT